MLMLLWICSIGLSLGWTIGYFESQFKTMELYRKVAFGFLILLIIVDGPLATPLVFWLSDFGDRGWRFYIRKERKGLEMALLKINVYSELCCDFCNDVIHNHMDCPACGKEYVDTDSYYDLYDDILDKQDCIIECEGCKAKFILRGDQPYDEDIEQWEKIEKVGEPITRKEALDIATNTLQKAEKDRIDSAKKEADSTLLPREKDETFHISLETLREIRYYIQDVCDMCHTCHGTSGLCGCTGCRGTLVLKRIEEDLKKHEMNYQARESIITEAGREQLRKWDEEGIPNPYK